jgi:hypothetical protein
MKRPAILALAALLAALLASGCASRFQGDAHADPAYDFGRAHTLAFVEGPRDDPEDSRRVRAQIEAELRRRLEAKGWRLVEQNEADLLVDFYAGLHAKVRMSGGAQPEGTVARMTLQFVEAATGESVWYGWTHETWRDSMEPGPEIEQAVAFLLERFPNAGGAPAGPAPAAPPGAR